jgi:thiol-disulfide isomerase/thioredoxin
MKRGIIVSAILAIIGLFFISCGNDSKTQYKVTFIEKYDSQCGACSVMDPIITELGKKYKNKVKFLRYDVLKSPDYEASKMYVTDRIPAFIFLDQDGKEYARIVGMIDAAQIENKFKEKGIEIK